MNTLLPVGSACTANEQCGGVVDPQCLSGIYPLSEVPGLETAGLTFTGGYCSAVPGCTSDAQCDPANGGRCFQPFHNSTAVQWAPLEESAGVADGFLANLLIPYGVCLKSCAAEADCRDPGYTCEVPLGDLLNPAVLVGVTLDNTAKFCVQPGLCFARDCGAGYCDAPDGMNAECFCPDGFTNDGDTCVPTCTPTCGDNSTCQAGTTENICVCDDGFEFDGTACIVAACQGSCGDNASFVRVDGVGALRCACDAGFVGDGFTCAAPACAATCDTNATCTANADRTDASCVCNAGFGGAGTACTAVGTTRYVDNSATSAADTGDCTSITTPCLTVGYAVEQAVSGDVVRVAAGTYAELVVVDKSLTFLGANAGVNAGVGMGSRTAESTVIGFRSPRGGGAHPSSTYAFDVTIDGFALRPQGNQKVLSWATYDMVSLYGGPMVRVVNNVFNGGTWNVDCFDADDPDDAEPRVLLCKDMADSALMIQSGQFEISGNSFENFRRPVDIAAWGATASDPVVPPHGMIAGNTFKRFSIRGIWLLDRFGGTVTIEGNDFDASDYVSTFGETAIIITSGGNVVRGNTFNGLGSALFVQTCEGSNTATYAANTYVNNAFTGNGSGIHYYQVGTDTSCVVSATIRGNAFTNTTRFAVRWNGNFTSSNPPATLDATGNWFGDAAGPEVLPYSYNMALDTSATRENVTPFVDVADPYTVSGGCTN